MSFIQTDVNYATDYKRELANAYPYLSYFSEIYVGANSSRYRPVMGKTVAIPSMSVSGAHAVNRNQITGTFNRNWNNEWQTRKMAMDREWDTIIDPMDIVETNDVATIANVTQTFNQFQKVPEQDAYAASQILSFSQASGGVDATSLSAANILAQWDTYLAYMTKQRVNRDRVIAYMTPDAYKDLKQAAGITRFIDAGTGIRNIDRNVGKLDGVTIYEVPNDMMMSAYDFSDGWAPKSNAVQINMLLADPLAIVAPIIYDVAMVGAPTAQSKGKYLYYERYYYDVFALDNRYGGFFANIASGSLAALTVTSAANKSSGTDITVTGTSTTRNTLLVYKAGATAPTVTFGTAVALTGANAWTKLDGDTAVNITDLTTGHYITVAEINQYTNMPVASGNAVVVNAATGGNA